MQEVKKENYLQIEKMETKYKINKAINKQVCVILFSEPVTSLTYVIFILLGYKPIECSIHSQCSDDQGKRHSEPVAMSSIYMLFAGREVRIVKNCNLGLHYTDRP